MVSSLIEEGGAAMFPIIALAALGLALVAVHLFVRRRWSFWASLAIVVVILGIGTAGTIMGRSRTDDAVRSMASATAAERAELRDAGYRESNRPIQLAGMVAGILAVGILIGGAGRRRLTIEA